MATYHGPLVYAEDPYRRLERASSDLELLLLLVFLKDAAHRAQREYRFAVWSEDEPAEDLVDIEVSPALLDAMQRSWRGGERSDFLSAGVEEWSALEEIGASGSSGETLHVEARPALAGPSNRTRSPQRYVVDRLPDDVRATGRSRRCEQRSTGSTRRAGSLPPRLRGTRSRSYSSSARPSVTASPGFA